MWKILSTKKIFEHPRITLLEDDVELPNGHKTKYLKFEAAQNAATIIAKNDEGKIMLSKQYSHPVQEVLWQFPGGGVPLSEKPEDGANRELIEETGHRASNLKLLGDYLMNNRRSTQKMFVYLGTDLVEDNSLEKDLEEGDIENFWISESEIDQMIVDNKIDNNHILSAWALYKLQK
ncbi:MAG: NUDIX hydrolase [Patescibacteria group bacterium]|jgi:8-oxo-dGTP pyrophosphatase MutT (NUDIX family)|nr:NUDIX hydrolase [Patescibacteria group bacterium]